MMMKENLMERILYHLKALGIGAWKTLKLVFWLALLAGVGVAVALGIEWFDDHVFSVLWIVIPVIALGVMWAVGEDHLSKKRWEESWRTNSCDDCTQEKTPGEPGV